MRDENHARVIRELGELWREEERIERYIGWTPRESDAGQLESVRVAIIAKTAELDRIVESWRAEKHTREPMPEPDDPDRARDDIAEWERNHEQEESV